MSHQSVVIRNYVIAVKYNNASKSIRTFIHCNRYSIYLQTGCVSSVIWWHRP